MDQVPVGEWCFCESRARVREGGGGGGGRGEEGRSGEGKGEEKGDEKGREYPPQAAKADILPLWVCRFLGTVKGER